MTAKEDSERNKDALKRELFLGRKKALEQINDAYRTFLIFNHPEFVAFSEGVDISVHKVEDDIPSIHNARRIQSVLSKVYQDYVRMLISETHDEVILERMYDEGVSAVKVHQPPKVYVEKARCGIKEDAIHALWLVRAPKMSAGCVSGYLMTNNYDDDKKDREDYAGEGSNKQVNPRAIQRIRFGDEGSLDFFKYDKESGLFTKSKDNTWGGREVAYNLAFHGLISFEHPISPQVWFSGVMKNLEDVIREQKDKTLTQV